MARDICSRTSGYPPHSRKPANLWGASLTGPPDYLRGERSGPRVTPIWALCRRLPAAVGWAHSRMICGASVAHSSHGRMPQRGIHTRDTGMVGPDVERREVDGLIDPPHAATWSAVRGRDPRVPTARTRRRVVAGWRRPHRPERAVGDRGVGAVSARRPGRRRLGRGESRVAQARAGSAADLPSRRGGRRKRPYDRSHPMG